MSVKAKLSFMISLIVFILLTIHGLVNNYSSQKDLRPRVQGSLLRIAEQITAFMTGNEYNADILRRLEKPEELLQDIGNGSNGILELTLFRLDSEAGETQPMEDNWTIVAGGNEYANQAMDMGFIHAAAQGEPVYHETAANGKKMVKGFFLIHPSEQLILSVTMDKTVIYSQTIDKRRRELFVTSGILLLIVILSSYLISGAVLRPIEAILWKINEVSFGRFDSEIDVRRKDELGKLAARIDAMSKNLNVYTAKLKQAFEENRSMKEFLESFINHTTDAIHVVDLNGRITRVNHAFEVMFGWTAKEAIGNSLRLVPEDYLAEEEQATDAVTSGRVLGARETMRLTRSGGRISVSVTTSPIRNRNGTIHAIASITRDMTSRNKMEDLLRQSEKLTTVGQLAAGVAHEIRNPLTTLRGFLQLQQQTKKLNPQHNDLMLSELDRINLIVSEFLVLAKPQANKFEVKDVRFVLGDVISLLDSQAHLCNIIIESEFCPDRCEISCEENQLKQVFINVLKNAIEAMPLGGKIRISVHSENERSIAIMIQDEGIGIPEEIIPKIGDPFFTGKESGTGLGIMVSKRIIHNHQGTLAISSKVNQGTTVTISLPSLGNQRKHMEVSNETYQ